MLNSLSTALQQISGIEDLEIVDTNLQQSSSRRLIPLAQVPYFLAVPVTVDYRVIYHCKLLCEQILRCEEIHETSQAQVIALQDGMTRILRSLQHLSMDNTMAVNAFDFLGDLGRYALYRDRKLLINTGLDRVTLETSRLKLRKNGNFDQFVRTGELLGYRTEHFTIIVDSDEVLPTMTKEVIQLHLQLLTKIDAHQRIIQKLEMMNTNLESLVAERSAELLHNNELLLEEKRKVDDVNERLHSMNEQLDRLSRLDPLTGVSNRRDLLERMQVELNRQRHTSCLLVCDLDYFKSINDTYGHDAGDYILRTVATAFQAGLRHTDILCRYGGDEFVIFMPDISLAAGRRIAERLRDHIAKMPIIYDEQSITLTLSIGVAACTAKLSISESFREADRNLYQAKMHGRNHVCAPSTRRSHKVPTDGFGH